MGGPHSFDGLRSSFMELASGLGLFGPDLRELERGERDRGGAGPVGGGGACASIREPLLGFWSAGRWRPAEIIHGFPAPPTEQALVGGFGSGGFAA